MTVGIFILGAVVTALVASALVLVFAGAVLDGRQQAPEDEPRAVARS